MASETILVEIPVQLVDQIQRKGYANVVDFLAYAVKQEPSDTEYTLEEMEAALEEGLGLLGDLDFTLDDVLAMKREEWALEERKLNLFQ